MSADPFTVASPTWQAAQRGVVRHRSAPIVRDSYRALNDPRELPAWMRPDHPKAAQIARTTRITLSGLVVTLVLMLVWWAGVQVAG